MARGGLRHGAAHVHAQQRDPGHLLHFRGPSPRVGGLGVAASEDVLETPEPTLSLERWDQLHAAGGRIVIGIEDLTDDEVAIMLSQQVEKENDDE